LFLSIINFTIHDNAIKHELSSHDNKKDNGITRKAFPPSFMVSESIIIRTLHPTAFPENSSYSRD